MDLRELRYFVAIVEGGSLSEASRRIHVVQPALSKRLAMLEEELGTQLLVRTRTGVAVTQAGTELYQRARLILKQVHAARDSVREQAGVAGGRVAVGILRSIAPSIGFALFQAIRRDLPAVVPEVVVGYSAELARQLQAARLDLTMQVCTRGCAPGHAEPLYRERLCLVGPHVLMQPLGETVRVADLRGIPLLLSSMQPLQTFMIDAARRAGVPLSIVGGIEDPASLLEACAGGLAATVLPEFALPKDAAQRGLVVSPIDEPGLTRDIVLLAHPEIPRTGAMLATERILVRVIQAFLRGRAVTQDGLSALTR